MVSPVEKKVLFNSMPRESVFWPKTLSVKSINSKREIGSRQLQMDGFLTENTNCVLLGEVRAVACFSVYIFNSFLHFPRGLLLQKASATPGFEDDKIYLSTCTTLFCLKAGNILAKYRKTLFAPDLHLKRIAPQENHILGLYPEKVSSANEIVLEPLLKMTPIE